MERGQPDTEQIATDVPRSSPLLEGKTGSERNHSFRKPFAGAHLFKGMSETVMIMSSHSTEASPSLVLRRPQFQDLIVPDIVRFWFFVFVF